MKNFKKMLALVIAAVMIVGTMGMAAFAADGDQMVDTTTMDSVLTVSGLAEGDTPETVEKSLLQRIPPEFLPNAHHWILLHGRYVCTARSPKCDECIIHDLCKRNY